MVRKPLKSSSRQRPDQHRLAPSKDPHYSRPRTHRRSRKKPRLGPSPELETSTAVNSFTGFLREEGLYEQVEAAALKKVSAAALNKQMDRRGMSMSAHAERLDTSRTAVGRVLDAQNTSITLNTPSRAASAVGCEVRLVIVPAA